MTDPAPRQPAPSEHRHTQHAHSENTPHRARPVALTIAVLTLAHAALISTLLLMFAWPALTSDPHDVPVGIVGPQQIVDPVVQRIDAQREGTLAFTTFDSPADAEQAIANREIYGAIVLGEQPEALVASAASPAVAQLLTDLTRTIVDASAAQAGIPVVAVTVTDVVAFTDVDPRGAAFSSLALPLVIGGISLAALAVLRLRSGRARAALVATGSMTTGLALGTIMTVGLGVLPASVVLISLAIAAILAALGYSLVGAHALFGMAGFGTLAALLFLLGNPLNGVALPPEFYAGSWGTVGQLMPVGAGFDLLRTLSFFEGASTTGAWTVLLVWAGVGATALVLGSVIRRARSARTAAEVTA